MKKKKRMDRGSLPQLSRKKKEKTAARIFREAEKKKEGMPWKRRPLVSGLAYTSKKKKKRGKKEKRRG